MASLEIEISEIVQSFDGSEYKQCAAVTMVVELIKKPVQTAVFPAKLIRIKHSFLVSGTEFIKANADEYGKSATLIEHDINLINRLKVLCFHMILNFYHEYQLRDRRKGQMPWVASSMLSTRSRLSISTIWPDGALPNRSL